jgi:RNA polymerase sigma-70 factor (ECF subfamily)
VTSEPSDAELVSRLRQGHPGAFDDLYRRYADRLWRFLRHLSGGRQVAEDLFQDTWVAAARNVRRLRPETDVTAWLYTIARNKHRNALRAFFYEGRRRDAAGAEPMHAPIGPDAQADARRRVRSVAEAFALLAEAHREVLILHAVEGLDAEQMAHVLGVRVEAVRKRLSRARAALVELTKTDCPRKGDAS